MSNAARFLKMVQQFLVFIAAAVFQRLKTTLCPHDNISLRSKRCQCYFAARLRTFGRENGLKTERERASTL
jgi:hypothetical protein